MNFVSYAQNMEDIMLWRALKGIDQGFYIDVGANDPTQDSVTKAFYTRGWRGINIEPVSQWFEKLESERPRDINLQMAVGSGKGELKFYEIPDTGLSTTDKAIAVRHKAEGGYSIIERKVPVKALSEICSDYHLAPIHFLKVDVEGAEKPVLEGMDFSKIRPWIIVIESVCPNTQIEDYKDWEPILLASDYKYVYFDGLNRYYVAVEHQEIENSFKIPPNVFDDYVFSGEGSSSFHLHQAHINTENQSLKSERAEIKDGFEQLAGELKAIKAEKERLINEKKSTSESLVHSDNMLIEQQAQNHTLRGELDAVRERLEQLVSEQSLAQSNNEKLAEELESKEEMLAYSDNMLTEQQDQNHTLRGELDAVRERLEQLASEQSFTQSNNEKLAEELESKDEMLAYSDTMLTEQQDHSQWLQNEWDAAKAKVEEMNEKSHHWWTVADGLNNELQTVYRSKSWSLTRPFRKLILIFNWLISLPLPLVVWFFCLPKRAARWGVVKVMRFALKHPSAKLKAMKCLRKLPVLETKLRQLAMARGLINVPHYTSNDLSQTVAREPEAVKKESVAEALKPEATRVERDRFVADEDLSLLTPRALNTYEKLKAALSKSQCAQGKE